MTYRRGRLALAGRIGGRFGFGASFLDCRCFLGGRSLGCFLRRTDFLLGSSIFGHGILFSRRLLGDCQCTKSKQSKLVTFAAAGFLATSASFFAAGSFLAILMVPEGPGKSISMGR